MAEKRFESVSLTAPKLGFLMTAKIPADVHT